MTDSNFRKMMEGSSNIKVGIDRTRKFPKKENDFPGFDPENPNFRKSVLERIKERRNKLLSLLQRGGKEEFNKEIEGYLVGHLNLQPGLNKNDGVEDVFYPVDKNKMVHKVADAIEVKIGKLFSVDRELLEKEALESEKRLLDIGDFNDEKELEEASYADLEDPNPHGIEIENETSGHPEIYTEEIKINDVQRKNLLQFYENYLRNYELKHGIKASEMSSVHEAGYDHHAGITQDCIECLKGEKE